MRVKIDFRIAGLHWKLRQVMFDAIVNEVALPVGDAGAKFRLAVREERIELVDEGCGVANLPHAAGEAPRSLARKAAIMARASLL